MDIANHLPRPDAVVAQMTEPLVKRARTYRNWGSVAMAAPGIAGGAVAAHFANTDGLSIFFICAIIAGLLPASAVYLYFSSQMKVAIRIARDGVTNIGHIASIVDGGGAKYIAISWADGRYAKVQATNVSSPLQLNEEVYVLVSPNVTRQVGVVLGDNGLYIADGK